MYFELSPHCLARLSVVLSVYVFFCPFQVQIPAVHWYGVEGEYNVAGRQCGKESTNTGVCIQIRRPPKDPW